MHVILLLGLTFIGMCSHFCFLHSSYRSFTVADTTSACSPYRRGNPQIIIILGNEIMPLPNRNTQTTLQTFPINWYHQHNVAEKKHAFKFVQEKLLILGITTNIGCVPLG